MMIRSVFVFLLALTLYLAPTLGQELVKPLQFNPVKLNHQVEKDANLNIDTMALELPFREDFSYKGPYPDGRLWADSFVFVNPDFPRHPKTVGVATFDAMDQHGNIYEQAGQTPFQFSADMLSSRPIRLDSVFSPAPMELSPSDSIMLSFYFQPQGRGSSPRDRDSLVLEFLHTPGHYGQDPEDPDNEIWIDDLWVSVWRAEGTTLEEFVEQNDSTFFSRVAVFIDDEVYLRDNFRFRFRNYASFPINKTPNNYAGNASIWNIDYIMLDYGRSVADSFYYDIAFVKPAQSLLRDYQAMPWKHYIADPESHLKEQFDVFITNLDNLTYNYTYRFFILDQAGNLVRNYSGGTWSIAPFHQDGYQSYHRHANPQIPANPLPVSPAEAREFTIHHTIREGTLGDQWPRNDTIVFTQVFDNYFAFDDGIPEAGYGISGFNPSAALRFVLSETDTLTAVQFYFNPTLHNQNEASFHIKVWKDLASDQVIYESDVVQTEYSESLNQFVTYELDHPLEVSDTIYVGWQQTNNTFLNIGFDTNNDASQHTFYNATGEWIQSLMQGAVMLRPVFGEQQFTSVSESTIADDGNITLYPNPVRGQQIHIEKQHLPSDFEVQITDITGRQVISRFNQTTINTSALPNGIYLLRIIPRGSSKMFTEKFIIAR